ncbi:MAG: Bifunctional folate synthesis protein [Anaerolineales bacterium]|nr:Bifunctional folate synthesis protein [Anaerolineales bacterium]
MPTVYLGLGSNQGDRLENIKKALRMLESQVNVQSVSSVYETEPWGVKDQPWFLNIACSAEGDLAPHALLDFLKDIERRLGRQQAVRYGPRRIDIDILFYEDQIVRHPELQIPHPQLGERAFVLRPLAEIAPGLQHPETGKPVRAMLAELEDTEVARKTALELE